MKSSDSKIGFIGQGYVGKNYANDLENRGYGVVRYALEKQYAQNKGKIKECGVVFVAVPTPTTPSGFDASIVEETFPLIGDGTTVVIKSTVVPGTTALWQEKYPRLIFTFSPEFLREVTAAEDAARPYSNIVGFAKDAPEHRTAAETVMSLLPHAPSKIICTATEAEIIKYAQNISGYIDIITFNVFYELTQTLGANWEPILQAMRADPNIPSRFANPIHKTGRGAGGHCLIKDMAALRAFYEQNINDASGAEFLRSAEGKNKQLLQDTQKDLDILKGVYGDQ